MSVFLFFAGLFQCLFLWLLSRVGLLLRRRCAGERELARQPQGWAPCALIAAVSGCHPDMEPALRSLAEQDYPCYRLYLVLGDADDPARPLADRLCAAYPHVECVIAGQSASCGQKNWNLLAGVARAEDRFPVYAFCDSTHLARPDFLRCLLYPICRGQAAFSTGYHEVEPRDQRITTLAYAISVLFMRLMQGIPRLVQPWGGAMAMSREAYEYYGVGAMWSENVVDDCSLAALLAKKGVHVRLCAGALLRTFAARQSWPVWHDWMERQILFLKFCMPGQWLGLGFFCAVMALPPIWFVAVCGMGILGYGSNMAPLLALLWLIVLWLALAGWRVFVNSVPARSHWLAAFFCACFMFFFVYAQTCLTRHLLWRGIIYDVRRGGRVAALERGGGQAMR